MCIFHKYETIETQTHILLNTMRDVSICVKCCKLRYTTLEIFTHNDDNIFNNNKWWNPKIDITQYKRDIKLNKILK